MISSSLLDINDLFYHYEGTGNTTKNSEFNSTISKPLDISDLKCIKGISITNNSTNCRAYINKRLRGIF